MESLDALLPSFPLAGFDRFSPALKRRKGQIVLDRTPAGAVVWKSIGITRLGRTARVEKALPGLRWVCNGKDIDAGQTGSPLGS